MSAPVAPAEIAMESSEPPPTGDAAADPPTDVAAAAPPSGDAAAPQANGAQSPEGPAPEESPASSSALEGGDGNTAASPGDADASPVASTAEGNSAPQSEDATSAEAAAAAARALEASVPEQNLDDSVHKASVTMELLSLHKRSAATSETAPAAAAAGAAAATTEAAAAETASASAPSAADSDLSAGAGASALDNADAGSVVTVESMDRSVTSNNTEETENSVTFVNSRRTGSYKKSANSWGMECYLYSALCVHILSCCTVCEEMDDYQKAEAEAKKEKLRIQAMEAAGEIDRFGCKRKKSKPRKKLTKKQQALLKKAGVKLSTDVDEEAKEGVAIDDISLNEATPSGQRRALMHIRETTEKNNHFILNWNDDWDFVEWQAIVWTPFKTERQMSRALIIELDLCYQHLQLAIEDIRPILGPQLEVLKIGWNRGLTGDIQAFENCIELTHINIHSTALVGNVEVFSENCPMLEVLGLSMTMVEGDMQVFEFMPALNLAYVDHTKLIGDVDAIRVARKKKKPFPFPPLSIHGYIHKWWEETDEDRRRRAVRTWRAGFTTNEDFFIAEAAGFPFKVGYDALVEAGFKSKKEYDACCKLNGYTEENSYDNHGVPIVMGMLEKAKEEAERKKREAAARALMFAKSDGAERHTPREEMKTIDINAQFAM